LEKSLDFQAQDGASWVLEHLETLSRDELMQIILNQHRLIEQLRAEIEQLKRRCGAAPFSKGTRKTDPKPPGRKPGQGFFRFRSGPNQKTEGEAVEVPVTVRCCPDCGGALGEPNRELVTTTDIPAQPQPEIRRYTVQTRACRECGRKVRGQHPDIAAGQQGATAHRVGPRVKALAHILHYVHGVPVRKTPAILAELTGVRLTQGAITQDAVKQSNHAVGATYEALRAAVRQQPVVHTDDTGWRVGGETAFLMAFVNPWLSVYQVRPRHRNEEVRELIPADFAGVLVCDRGRSYDAVELQALAQQKCLAHLIRNAATVQEQKAGRAGRFAQRLKDLLQEALLLSSGRNEMNPAAYRKQVRELHAEVTTHLRHRRLRDPDNQRLLNGAGNPHDRGHLLRFLTRYGVEPTNNRAERDLRPAVIARKVSHCSKNTRGAKAFEAFTSVLQTLRKLDPSATAIILTKLMTHQPVPS
jgi:transposase